MLYLRSRNNMSSSPSVRVYRRSQPSFTSPPSQVLDIGRTIVNSRLQNGWIAGLKEALIFQGDSHLVNNYPPYSLRQRGNDFVLELAVAGISPERLGVKVQDNLLTVSCNDEEEEKDDWEYLLNTRAARKFTREYILQDDVQVTGSELKDGLLLVFLHLPSPIEPDVCSIPISLGKEDNEEARKISNESFQTEGKDSGKS